MDEISPTTLLRTVLQLRGVIFFLTLSVVMSAPANLVFGSDKAPLPWEITADRITREQKPEKILAEGNVLLQQFKDEQPTGLTIEAEKILYNTDENSIDATGGLHLSETDYDVKAAEARLELDHRIGVFKEASIFWKKNNLHVSAELIEKTAEDVYHIEKGRFTACPVEENNSPDWSIWGNDVEISPDDYARLKHATFRVKDIPVFYLPYLLFPIGDKKQTGFLFPEYSTSQRLGTGLIAPFFLNLSPSYDMTLFPGYYSDRGPLLAAEFRYAAGYHSRGSFMVNYLDDDLTDTPALEFKSDGLLRTNANRYWFRGKADHDFGNRLVARLDLDIVSDRDYLQEFRKGMIGFDQSNNDFLDTYSRGFQNETIDLRENTLQFSKVWPTTDLLTEINIINDVRDAQNDTTPPWTIPRVTYSGLLPFLQSPLDLVWGTEYVYFWRDEGVGAHRVDLFPQLNGPLAISPYLESSYLVGVRETMYFLEPHDNLSEALYTDDFESRTLYNLLLTGATTLSRDYDIDFKEYKTFRHAIRPELTYLLAKGSDQDDLPMLDEEDRITEKNWLQFSLNNYFRGIRHNETSLFRANYSSLKISQVYDLDAGEHAFSDIYLEFIVRGFRNLFLRYETSVSVYGEGVTTYSLETRYRNKRGDRLNLDYRYKRNPDISPPYFFSDAIGESVSELRTNLQSRLSKLFSVKFDNIYSLSSENTVNSTLSLIYHNPCWTLEFAANRTPDDTGFYLLFSLVGISSPVDFELPEF